MAKFSIIFKYNILPLSILLLFLLQLYFQYSTLISLRPDSLSQKDGRDSTYHYNMTQTKIYDFNLNAVNKLYEDNILKKISFFRELNEKYFESLKKDEATQIDTRTLKIYSLFFFDAITLGILYLFLFEKIWAGFVIIFLQAYKIYSGYNRLKENNPRSSLYLIIFNKINNKVNFRNEDILDPEGYSVLEFGCNIIIIFEIIFLVNMVIDHITKCRNKKIEKEKNEVTYVDSVNDDEGNNKPENQIVEEDEGEYMNCEEKDKENNKIRTPGETEENIKSGQIPLGMVFQNEGTSEKGDESIS